MSEIIFSTRVPSKVCGIVGLCPLVTGDLPNEMDASDSQVQLNFKGNILTKPQQCADFECAALANEVLYACSCEDVIFFLFR
jgi:hypothetical protein